MTAARTMEEIYPGCYAGTLSNGVKVLFEPRPDRPLSLGLWAKLGSRDEPPELAGIAHFLEHMVFKGTAHRTAFQISAEIDALGGSINAMTSKEYTTYFVDVLPHHLEAALDVLADLLLNPLFRPEDIEKERNVVLEEIRMQEDTPHEKVFELFSERLWDSEHPLARPIAGRFETVSRFDREALWEFFALYDTRRVFLAAVGDVSPDELLRAAEEKLGGLREPQEELPPRTPPQPQGGLLIEDRELQQAHICLGTAGLPKGDPRRYALEVLNAVLGGGMSSRLFKRIREDLGLAYAVFSHPSYYSDSGQFVIYLGTEPKNARQALEICREEIERLTREPVDDETLRIAKEKLKGHTLLGLESSHARMIRLGYAEIYQTHHPVEEVLRRVEAVTAEDVRGVARDLFLNDHYTLTVVGPEKQLASLERAIPALA